MRCLLIQIAACAPRSAQEVAPDQVPSDDEPECQWLFYWEYHVHEDRVVIKSVDKDKVPVERTTHHESDWTRGDEFLAKL